MDFFFNPFLFQRIERDVSVPCVISIFINISWGSDCSVSSRKQSTKQKCRHVHCCSIFIFDCALQIVFLSGERHTSLLWFVAQLFAWKKLKHPSPLSFYSLQSKCWVIQFLDLRLAGQNLEFLLVMIQWSYRPSVCLSEKRIFLHFSALMLLLLHCKCIKGKRKGVFWKRSPDCTFL